MGELDGFDAIVVGSGATGGWAAKDLTAAGLRVLVLEAGPQADDRPPPGADEERWRERRPIQGASEMCDESNYHLFVDDIDNPYTTPADARFHWIRGRQVGGRTMTWKGACYRLSDATFKAATRDGFGVDWPIGYEDLKPYYDSVEAFLGVSGSSEGIAEIPDGIFSPCVLSEGERRLKEVVEQRWPDRRVIPNRVARRAAHASLNEALAVRSVSSPETTLAAAAQTERLTLRTNTVVSRVLIDEDTGRAKGVAFIDRLTHKEYEAQAKVIVLCASTVESTRLLLNSESRQHPGGLGGSSGVLGHYLVDKVRGRMLVGSAPGVPGYSTSEDDWYSTGVCIPRFRNVGEPDPRFLRGYGIVARVHPWMSPSDVRGMPGAEADNHRLMLESNPPAIINAFAMGEMLPRFENRVTLSRDARDAWGIPVAHIECGHGDNERAMASDMIEALGEISQAAGWQIWMDGTEIYPPGGTTHEVGTARMGADPRTSVLDPFNRCWDVKNLFVTDGSCFPSSGWQNPTLTMMAITARACAYIVDQLKRGDL